MKPEELHPTAAALNDDDGRSAYQPGAPHHLSPGARERVQWPYTKKIVRAAWAARQRRRHRREHKRKEKEQMRLWDNRPGQTSSLDQVRAALQDAGWQYEVHSAQERGASNAAYRVYTLRCRPHAGEPWRYPDNLSEVKQWVNEEHRGVDTA